MPGFTPHSRYLTLACSSRPIGTSSSGTLGMTASASSSALSRRLPSASAPVRNVFSWATSAISRLAVASSFCALALPISLDAVLRRPCASSSFRIWARRASSRAMTSATVAPASASEIPRLPSACARASGLSRIHLMSSMAGAFVSKRRGGPLPVGEEAPSDRGGVYPPSLKDGRVSSTPPCWRPPRAPLRRGRGGVRPSSPR